MARAGVVEAEADARDAVQVREVRSGPILRVVQGHGHRSIPAMILVALVPFNGVCHCEA